MDGLDSLGLFSNGLFDLLGIQTETIFLDIDKDRGGTCHHNCRGRREKRERCRYNFITRAYIISQHGQVTCSGTIARGNGMFYTRHIGKFLLKMRYFGALCDYSGSQNSINSCPLLGTQLRACNRYHNDRI